MSDPPSHHTPSPPPPVAIVVSRYHGAITSRLLDGAVEAYTRRGGVHDNLGIVDAPGSYELVALALAAANTQVFAGVLALGCIVRGETSHDRVLADAIAKGLLDVTLATGKPVSFGVLTVETTAQALERAGGGSGNKGEEGMLALLDSIRAAEAIAAADSSRTPGAATVSIHRTIAKLGGAGSA
ncbi:MAG: 6,7-dimethyl-8-ribityllumazine synthase [Phycisphaeraceae bacterium]|nr:6,7-dimethyl-8-ribityllumazine synthase [Phycisphaeraceae bacterium]MCW5754301.1 6,7-dimethyl-8-ribityllumazine synthase [Phycisphaeraceae bacterium]